MDRPDVVTHADRRLMIGVLAHLAAAFLDAHGSNAAAEPLMQPMMNRFRRDLERDLGRPPADSECYELLEAQVDRLRRSIGEYD